MWRWCRSVSASLFRSASTQSEFKSQSQSQCAWQVTKFGDVNEVLKLNKSAPMPVINKPNQLLIAVHASSVNPLDIKMAAGYCHTALHAIQKVSKFGRPDVTSDRLPLTLGRDFCGQVVGVGQSVKKYRVGDLVWGAVSPQAEQGAHATHVVASENEIDFKPSNLTDTEAASIPYAGLTAWSAISTIGGVRQDNASGKKALVLGGSGGVGNIAIQLLKCWDAHVTATCSKGAIDWLYEVSKADHLIDYNTDELQSLYGTFDFVLDTTGQATHIGLKYLRKLRSSKYVTLSSPVFTNIDRHGLLLGTVLSVMQGAKQAVTSNARWGFFSPNSGALEQMRHFIEVGKMKPVIEKVYNFNELPLAYSKISAGHARGKTVIDMTNKGR